MTYFYLDEAIDVEHLPVDRLHWKTLDWAVAKVIGCDFREATDRTIEVIRAGQSLGGLAVLVDTRSVAVPARRWQPTASLHQAFPLFREFGVDLISLPGPEGLWSGVHRSSGTRHLALGALVAGCRTLVAGLNGQLVSVPRWAYL